MVGAEGIGARMNPWQQLISSKVPDQSKPWAEPVKVNGGAPCVLPPPVPKRDNVKLWRRERLIGAEAGMTFLAGAIVAPARGQHGARLIAVRVVDFFRSEPRNV